MPENKTVEKPPEPMTWPRASKMLVLAFIFDALRFMFEMFWFFGPAFAALYCTSVVNDVLGTTVASIVGKAVAAGCAATATAAGVLGAPAITVFGVVMAMAVGFLGWLVIGTLLFVTNPHIFKGVSGNGVRFIAALFVSEVPFLNALPAMTFNLWRMYHTQIKKETADIKKWEKENAERIAQEQGQQAARIAQIQQLQTAQAQQAANEELFEQEQAANDERFSEEEIPRKVV